MILNRFPFVAQHDQMDCGPACLSMIARFHGKKYPLPYLRENSYLSREGVSLNGLVEAAKLIGFECIPAKLSLEKLTGEVSLPCVLFWTKEHFVVLYKIRKKRFTNKWEFKIADPAAGFFTINEKKFRESWEHWREKGVVLMLQPGDNFHETLPPPEKKIGANYLLRYLSPHKAEIFQLILAMGGASIFMLVLPILTQLLIDKGIAAKNNHWIVVILLAQIFLFFGTMAIEIVRNWILLYLGARINISIISDYFKKMLKLPMRFFETKFIGDFYQRISDHSRIETFLTSQSLTTFFSLINFSIFFVVLFYYATKIVFVYIAMTALAVSWSVFFLKKRANLDYFRFKTNALNQQSVVEIISGIEEIKLNNLENYKREEWEEVQLKIFNVNITVLQLDQLQVTGFDLINQLKNIIVTFIAAHEVIAGHVTIGGLLSVMYIIGQMNSPVSQLIVFFRSFQDAKLSIHRLTEVQTQQDEEIPGQLQLTADEFSKANQNQEGIRLAWVSFKYHGPFSPFVLKDVNLYIPSGKITAIVGSSGSGKTTLMKMLLKFYEPLTGEIFLNDHPLNAISALSWRKNCGVVMQDGFIFSDTIGRNIATSDIHIDEEKLKMAIKIANIGDFIDNLPLKTDTRLGASGNGISGGQRQRLLIARAVYKQPQYIFFDEATSSLDTENEKIIHDHLREFFKGKTVVIIAHRLSTVKNADQIIVMKDGRIAECGDHDELVAKKEVYFNLVKNQLELEDC